MQLDSFLCETSQLLLADQPFHYDARIHALLTPLNLHNTWSDHAKASLAATLAVIDALSRAKSECLAEALKLPSPI